MPGKSKTPDEHPKHVQMRTSRTELWRRTKSSRLWIARKAVKTIKELPSDQKLLLIWFPPAPFLEPTGPTLMLDSGYGAPKLGGELSRVPRKELVSD